MQRRNAAPNSDDEEEDSESYSNTADYYHHDNKMYEDYENSDVDPAFMPLEEHNNDASPDVVASSPPVSSGSHTPLRHHDRGTSRSTSGTLSTLARRIQNKVLLYRSSAQGRKLLALFAVLFLLKILVATIVLKHLGSHNNLFQQLFHNQWTISGLLQWTQKHPLQGMVCLILVIAGAVVVMVPVGTPLTLGCGYIYKGAYGWKLGLSIATFVAIGGSALGAVICFVLGRYLMREQVRLWTRKYPLFDAIDIATKENGLKIMAMLYLTPILPLGPVSYMCGTTSMKLSHFAVAKIASLPLMFLYTFIGASMSALIGTGSKGMEDELKEIESNRTLILSGICLSFVMIAGITHHIRKELNRILERQQKLKPGEKEDRHDDLEEGDSAAIELKPTRRRAV